MMKKALAALLLAGAAATCYALLFGGEGYRQMRQLQDEIAKQNRGNEEAREDNENIAEEIRAAKENPASAEKRLREHYFIKEDEILIIPPEEK
ncbi:MAG: FtsB family cell division protein [Gammaproteobacteria bacterium]